MSNQNLGRTIRCTGLALLVLGFLALVPSDAKAGVCATPAIHGASIFKSCTSPVNRCATDADCTDGVFCNGVEQCSTGEGAPPVSNLVDCSITIGNPLEHCDSITVTEISDAVLNGTGSPATSSALLVTGTTGTVSGDGCDVGSDLGSVATETCTLQTSASITVRANYYTAQALDPTPLNDQASGTVIDNCDGGTTGCSSSPNVVQFTAATTLQSGCGPGTPVSCPDDANLCNGSEFCDENADACGHQNPLDCNDNLFCTDDSCVAATGCAHVPHNCADTDECTIDSCNDDTDMCVHAPDPACEVTEFCRTPGFWGTHADADADKGCSQNITQAVIEAAGGSIEVCGITICNTEPDDQGSAVEAMCMKTMGVQSRQLVRQLTAARLNCIVSGETGGACDGISINEIFDKCNMACPADLEVLIGTDTVNCIDALDCFNNGGTFDPATGDCHVGNCSIGGAECSEELPCGAGEGECVIGESCHTQPFPEDFPLPNNSLPSSDPCFEKQGPAGSSDECRQAHKTTCSLPDNLAACDTNACAP